MITITRRSGAEPLDFDVVVSDASGTSRHRVSLTGADRASLVNAQSPKRLVEAALRFLLDREAKESILARFDLSVIARHFPEFECKPPRYLADGE